MLARLALFALVLAPVGRAAAQTDAPPAGRNAEPVFSMGQPRAWLPYVSAFGSTTRGSLDGGSLLAGVEHPVLNPITGLLGATGEVAAMMRHGRASASLRASTTIPAFGLGFG